MSPSLSLSMSPLVLKIREREEVLTAREAMRELLQMLPRACSAGNPIGPLKPHLGEPFRKLEQQLQALVGERYALPAWAAAAYRRHKAADRLAAASEACHVVGWSREDMRDVLGIVCEPLEEDPLPMPSLEPWEPWSPRVAERMFLHRLLDLQARAVLHESAEPRSCPTPSKTSPMCPTVTTIGRRGKP